MRNNSDKKDNRLLSEVEGRAVETAVQEMKRTNCISRNACRELQIILEDFFSTKSKRLCFKESLALARQIMQMGSVIMHQMSATKAILHEHIEEKRDYIRRNIRSIIAPSLWNWEGLSRVEKRTVVLQMYGPSIEDLMGLLDLAKAELSEQPDDTEIEDLRASMITDLVELPQSEIRDQDTVTEKMMEIIKEFFQDDYEKIIGKVVLQETVKN